MFIFTRCKHVGANLFAMRCFAYGWGIGDNPRDGTASPPLEKGDLGGFKKASSSPLFPLFQRGKLLRSSFPFTVYQLDFPNILKNSPSD